MGRFYAGRPILAQFCPVTDFKDARCRQVRLGPSPSLNLSPNLLSLIHI